jgi:hypothetical protein
MLLRFDILSVRSSDMNLQEEEILKLAFLGNHGNLDNVVDVLKRSFYKEQVRLLISLCRNTLFFLLCIPRVFVK